MMQNMQMLNQQAQYYGMANMGAQGQGQYMNPHANNIDPRQYQQYQAMLAAQSGRATPAPNTQWAAPAGAAGSDETE